MAMELKLAVLTDLSGLPKQIDSNYDVVKAALNEALKKYDNLVVTDENYKEMKDLRAEINKGVAAIKSVGKEVKDKLMAPFLPFDAKVKELAELAVAKSAELDAKIKEVEQARKDKKRKDIAAHFKEAAAASGLNLKDEHVHAHFQRFASENKRWMNETYKLKAVYADIDAEFKRAADAVEQVARLFANDLEVVKVKAASLVAQTGYDVGQTCEMVNAFKDEERKLAEARARDEAERKAREEARERAEAERKAREEAAKAAQGQGHADASVGVQGASVDAKTAAMEAAKAALRAARERMHGGGGQSAPVAAVRPVVAGVDSKADTVAETEANEVRLSTSTDSGFSAGGASEGVEAPTTGATGAAAPTGAASAPSATGDAAVAGLKPTRYKVTMEFIGTTVQMRGLRDYMDRVGIDYEVVGDAVEVA